MEYEIKIIVNIDIKRLEKKANELGFMGYKPSGPVTVCSETNTGDMYFILGMVMKGE